jgi:Leucine-rich repeat (LRR) protein
LALAPLAPLPFAHSPRFLLLSPSSFRLQALEHCRRAQVVYLYGNRLTTIECLGSLVNLSHLFLQSNNITKLQGFEALSNLQKLFLSRNRIRFKPLT